MGLLSYKRNDSFPMLLCEWKVKGKIASGNSPGFQPKLMTCVRNVAFLGETPKTTLQEGAHNPASLTRNLELSLKMRLILIIDKNFLFRGGSIGGLFLLVKGYFASCCIEKQGLAMRFE
jgi:hypothetical protein